MTDMRAVRASGPDDLLALAPGLLGFHPEDSVVLLTVGGASQPFHARVDLPTDVEDIEALADYLADVAVRGGVARVALLLYTDDACLAREVAVTLGGHLVSRSVEVVCMVRADGLCWWRLPGEESNDDGAGTPYDVGSHPLMAQTVVEGTVVLRDRRELADSLVGTDPQEAEEVATQADAVVSRLARTLADSRGHRSRRHQLGSEARWVSARIRRFLDDGERLHTVDLARLVTMMSVHVAIRDVALAELDQASARRHVDLWRDVVRRAPVEVRAAPATLLAFAAWLSGNGALAWCAVECAQEAEPDYSMAGLLASALAGAVPPSAWKPFPSTELSILTD